MQCPIISFLVLLFVGSTHPAYVMSANNDKYTRNDDVMHQTIFRRQHYPDQPRPCPCSSDELCERVVNKPHKEVFVFTVNVTRKEWLLFDWTKVTTVVPFENYDDELMCYAHSKGARVLLPDGGPPTDQLTNATARTRWVNKVVSIIVFNFMDGINLDFERSFPASRRDLRDGLTSLIQELSEKLRPLLPDALITTDFPWMPNGYGRYYDYPAITELLDFLVIMDYDEPRTSEYSLANCGYTVSLQGVKDYMNLGIAADKIVMAFPWYGYYYLCKSLEQQRCIQARALRQIGYSEIIEVYLDKGTPLWDPVSKSPYLDIKDEQAGHFYQLWYDNVTSLTAKYQLAAGLRGVGMWHATLLNYTDPTQIRQMWDALP